MKTWIVLFRGINVGGRNLVPMKTLVELLESLGCTHVKTYIQSGNVVLRSPEKSAAALGKSIQAAIESRMSFEPSVLLLSADQLIRANDQNPFPEGASEPASLHFFFLSGQPEEYDEKELDALRAPTERFQLLGNVFYLHAPDGIGRSKLAANVEKRLGVATTARNFRTVGKILQLAADMLGG